MCEVCSAGPVVSLRNLGLSYGRGKHVREVVLGLRQVDDCQVRGWVPEALRR